MTDGLRKSHLRKAPQVGLSEVGLPDIYLPSRSLTIAIFLIMVTEIEKGRKLWLQNMLMLVLSVIYSMEYFLDSGFIFFFGAE